MLPLSPDVVAGAGTTRCAVRRSSRRVSWHPPRATAAPAPPPPSPPSGGDCWHAFPTRIRPWRDVDGTHSPAGCRVEQIAVAKEHGAVASRLHQRGAGTHWVAVAGCPCTSTVRTSRSVSDPTFCASCASPGTPPPRSPAGPPVEGSCPRNRSREAPGGPAGSNARRGSR